MIKLKDFLKVASSPINIRDGFNVVITINDAYFDNDLLSEKLLNSEVEIVEVSSTGKSIDISLKEDI